MSRSLSRLVTLIGSVLPSVAALRIRPPALGEQTGHPLHPSAPGGLQFVQGTAGPAQGVGIGPHELLPSAALLDHETGPLQYRDVLLHRGEAHRIGLGQPGHRQVVPHAAAQDVAAGQVGQGLEQAVRTRFRLFDHFIYNHLVVRYASRHPP